MKFVYVTTLSTIIHQQSIMNITKQAHLLCNTNVTKFNNFYAYIWCVSSWVHTTLFKFNSYITNSLTEVGI